MTLEPIGRGRYTGRMRPSSASYVSRRPYAPPQTAAKTGALPTALEATAIVYYGAIVVGAVVVLVLGAKLIAGFWASPAGQHTRYLVS